MDLKGLSSNTPWNCILFFRFSLVYHPLKISSQFPKSWEFLLTVQTEFRLIHSNCWCRVCQFIFVQGMLVLALF